MTNITDADKILRNDTGKDIVDKLEDIIDAIGAEDNSYSKAEADQKFATKTSLSEVATSGKYDDLLDKPSVAVIDDTQASASKVYSSNKVVNLLGNKASASEVENIRIGADGTSYASAGDAVRNQISDLQIEIDNLSDNFDDISRDSKNGIEIPIFDNYFGLKLFDNGNGKYKVNKRYKDFYKDAMYGIDWTKVYLNPLTGNDSNDGTKEHPVKTFTTALGFAGNNIRVIMPAGNFSFFNQGIYGSALNTDFQKNIMIDCEDGVYCQRYGLIASTRSWTNTGNGVWQTNILASPLKILDGENYYDSVVDVSECTSTPSSFVHISGVLYVHTTDGEKPADQFLEYDPACKILAQSNANILIFKNIYLVNGKYSKPSGGLELRGNSSITSFKMFIENCCCGKFVASGYNEYYFYNLTIDGEELDSNNGIYITASSKTWIEKCISKNCGADGYNYHNTSLTGFPFVVELECCGLNCGMKRTETLNNCTTMHDNFKGIRIGGIYFNSRDKVIHDVNNSKSFNAFCTVRQSKDGANETYDFAVGAGANDATEMEIYNCDVSGSNSTYNIGVYGGNSNIIKSWGTRFDRIKTDAIQINTEWNPFAD